MTHQDKDKLEQIVANARREREVREKSYREKALKMYPWVCGRCGREFNRQNLRELTVHHRDHDHDNNPEDGSNWELLCLFCHDNEHQRFAKEIASVENKSGTSQNKASTHKPFADLRDILKTGK